VTGPQGAGAPGPQGAASIDQVRSHRERTSDQSGNTFIKEGDRTIVRTGGGKVVIQTDENERFRRFAPNAKVEVRGNERFAVYERPGNVQIVNITDNNGRLLRRVRRGSDGREVVLIENRRGPGFGTGLAVGLAVGVGVGAIVALNLPPPVITIPRERYIVDLDVAPPDLLYETLAAAPLMAIERPYTLDEIRYNVELRDRMRRIDINTITFETGSWTVTPDQYDRLAGIAEAIGRLLQRRPDEVVMIEGHTDAVGNDEDNLSLSDRRAETVASVLIEQFGIPAENLVTQGYGEQYLKIPTQDPNRLNRRVAVRPIGALLAGNYRN
jgi:OmpA-OmpF porin, OOP family